MAEAVPNTEEIPTQTSHTQTAESPASMRRIWAVSSTQTQAKTAAAPAKTEPWRRSASAASSALVRRTRSAGGWGTGKRGESGGKRGELLQLGGAGGTLAGVFAHQALFARRPAGRPR